uniref:Tubby C-terminal domain-containing protein n=1 Tax=Opuntia streptacantha TaxID=393608 RepID=A0A7C9AS35_OPUST
MPSEMAALKKPTILCHSSYDALYSNPLIELNNNVGCKENDHVKKRMMRREKAASDLGVYTDGKENQVPMNENEFGAKKKKNPDGKLKDKALKSSSLQLCMKMNEPESSFGFGFGFKVWDSADTESVKSVNVWDYSDSEAAPASSWSTVPNRSLLFRPLPKDIGSCSCIIVKEAAPAELGGGGSVYSLYTNEGKGRQNRKLAVASHRRRNGRSSFTVAQNAKGVLSISDDSFIGLVTANLMGSRYYIWDQGHSPRGLGEESKLLQGFVEFTPTISSWTGRYRSIRAWIPKHQPLQLKNTTNQVQNVKGLPLEWEEQKDQVHLLLSRVPKYNKISKQYELDFREKVRSGLQIQRSVKNFQLTMEGNGRQTILQLGRVGKSKYVLDYKHPLSGYQAFCICLASIDVKLCCTV